MLHCVFFFQAEDGIRDRDVTGVQTCALPIFRVEPRSRFPETLEAGMHFEGSVVGDDEDRVFTVTDMAEDKVVLDANHPLAGMAIKFSCTVVGVRPATEAEIRNGATDDPESVILRILP